MKAFLVYTAWRIVFFIAAWIAILGLMKLLAGDGDLTATAIGTGLVAAFVVSGIASYKFLGAQREALARRVESRADKMTARIDQLRSSEDTTE